MRTSFLPFLLCIAAAGSLFAADSDRNRASKETPFVNSLGMKFVPVSREQRRLFSIWDTRVKDYEAYARVKKVDNAWTNQERDGVPVGRGADYPVVGVSWDDANAFCQCAHEKGDSRREVAQRNELSAADGRGVAPRSGIGNARRRNSRSGAARSWSPARGKKSPSPMPEVTRTRLTMRSFPRPGDEADASDNFAGTKTRLLWLA